MDMVRLRTILVQLVSQFSDGVQRLEAHGLKVQAKSRTFTDIEIQRYLRCGWRSTRAPFRTGVNGLVFVGC